MITVIDEFSREYLAIRAARKMRSDHVLQLFTELFTLKGVPEHIRSDNGAETAGRYVYALSWWWPP